MSSEPKSSEPKYPVGSSVFFHKYVDSKQFIVSEFLPPKSGIRVLPAYRIFPVGDPDNNWTVTETELSPWVESKYRPGQVIQLTHDKKIVVEAVYIKEGTIIVDFVEYFHDKPVIQYKEILEDSLDDKIKVHEYQKNIEILTKDNQTYTNEQGGKQSFVSARFDCIPPVVLRLLAQCLGFGARKYGKENWQQIDQVDHLNHAMNHINEWNRGDRSEPHLVNAMARLTFALWQAVEQGQQPDTYIHPDEVK